MGQEHRLKTQSANQNPEMVAEAEVVMGGEAVTKGEVDYKYVSNKRLTRLQ